MNKMKSYKFERNSVFVAAGIWNDLKETGIEYEKRMRSGWNKRVPTKKQ